MEKKNTIDEQTAGYRKENERLHVIYYNFISFKANDR
jgi:hypothetical protein